LNKEAKVSHAKISSNLADNVVSICNADRFKVAFGVLISPYFVLGCKHYGDVRTVLQKVSHNQGKVAEIIKTTNLIGPSFDQLTLYELKTPMVYRTMKLGVHTGTKDGIVMGGEFYKYLQLSSITKDNGGYLRWNGDSAPGDCGGMILDTDGKLIGIHAGKDLSNTVSKALFGLPLLNEHISFFREKGIQAF